MALAPAMCMQCGRLVDGRVITLDGETYCCLGCIGGSPCTCEGTLHPLESIDVNFPEDLELALAAEQMLRARAAEPAR